MSSFTMPLLEEGVDVELPVDLAGIIEIMDEEVRTFTHEGHGYALAPGKGTLGSRWDFLVKYFDHNDNEILPSSLGRFELHKLDDDHVHLRVPPREEQETPEMIEDDPEGRFFGSFVYQTLNALQRHKLIDLPAALPTA